MTADRVKDLGLGPVPSCYRPSTDIDHIDDEHDHSDANLRGMCEPCHDHRSAMQGVAARGDGPLRRRPAEPHPGMVRDDGRRGGG